jgi:hypothetical protein
MKKIKINKVIILSLSLMVILGLTSLGYAANSESKATKLAKSYKENVKKKKDKDKIVAKVNDINIYASEVDYLKWQYDCAPNGMKPFSEEDNNTANIIKIIAKDKLILDEAKRSKITLTDIEREQIQKINADSFDKNTKENQEFLDTVGMTKEEVTEMLVEMQANALIESRFISKKVVAMISDTKFQTDDKDLANLVAECQQFTKQTQNNQDSKTKFEKVKNLYEAYKNSLFVKAKFKVLN